MRLLLLAGTSDSAQIAGALAKENRIVATASIARAVRSPISLGLPTRIGGWGSDEAFADWLVHERVDAILDVTHPFAERITRRASTVSRELGIDYLHFLRPPWLPGPEDRWLFLNDCSEVSYRVPDGVRLLIDTEGRGNQHLGFLNGRTVHCRLREPVNGIETRGAWNFIFGRGPFTLDDEITLYRSLRLDWLVLPNVGGAEGCAKLEAARRVGLKLAMIRRPPQPEAPRATTVSEVVAWVRRRL